MSILRQDARRADSAVGKRAKCPACGQIMIVPGAAQAAEQFGSPPTEAPAGPYSPQPAAGGGEDWLSDLSGPGQAAGPVDSSAGSGERRPCPECGEMIVAGAAKCRFCGAVFDPRLRAAAARSRAGQDDEKLAAFDWILCILCSNIGCIVGIVYAVQGKPKGMKMVGISILVNVVAFFIGFLAQLANQPHLHH